VIVVIVVIVVSVGTCCGESTLSASPAQNPKTASASSPTAGDRQRRRTALTNA
jgi:hypothetical protein